ncbi:aminotransferase class V-fold PLP-dependent enzyme [Reyranella aquatilis]|jgi:selenocysteine lyase/cysteine desulfurase|uniref:Aminotransferase class V-fold PLP-dependent enzyme n=1 Tax=Reyranella aquatilis TaxID=2035356 RepID=A0ABS8KSB4_9HYPH|nr:aminotransferase class V-fold PLP-dependent enzyme [Reyranella aquatilis]MCC8428965.1 aminotransferase class V-fold PLP-dependent enzyme [Reyranella aquatilis]
MALDIDRIRDETPGCAHVLHLNAAGSSLPSRRTLDATIDHLRLEAEIGGYEAADRARPVLDGFYPSIATLIGAEPGEIAYVENATRAWDLAFYSLDFKPGDRILTCVSEYSSNYISYLQVAKKTGAEIVVIPDDKHGQIDLAALERAIDKRTKLVSISHIPTQGGLVQPAEAVGKIVNDAGILYLLDACQSVGMMPVDVKKIGCDFLSATGRKYMRGPRGTGFLYARQRSTAQIEPIFLDNHAARWSGDNDYTVMPDAKRFENWERYFAGVIGLKVAADQCNELGMPAIWARLRELADGLRTRLATVKGVTLTDLGVTKGAIVTFAVDGKDHPALKQALRDQRINVSVSTQFSSRLDLKGRGLKDVMRASVHVYNTEEELDRFVAALRPLVAG